MNLKVYYRITQDRAGIPMDYTGARHFVVPEGQVVEELAKAQLAADYALLNRKLVIEVAERILDLLVEPMPAEALMTCVLRAFDAPVVDAGGYYLLHPTIFAFLSHLERNRVVEHVIDDRRSLWRRI